MSSNNDRNLDNININVNLEKSKINSYENLLEDKNIEETNRTIFDKSKIES